MCAYSHVVMRDNLNTDGPNNYGKPFTSSTRLLFRTKILIKPSLWHMFSFSTKQFTFAPQRFYTSPHFESEEVFNLKLAYSPRSSSNSHKVKERSCSLFTHLTRTVHCSHSRALLAAGSLLHAMKQKTSQGELRVVLYRIRIQVIIGTQSV